MIFTVGESSMCPFLTEAKRSILLRCESGHGVGSANCFNCLIAVLSLAVLIVLSLVICRLAADFVADPDR